MVDRDRLTCFITYVIVYKGLTGWAGYSIVLLGPAFSFRHLGWDAERDLPRFPDRQPGLNAR